MKTLFNPDGPLMRILSRMATLMALNVCFLLCCIPVFTIGASITALYATLFLQRDESTVRRFFREFRRNFRQGVTLGLILGAAGCVLALDIYWLPVLAGGFALVKYLLYLAVITWIGVSSYAFGLAARFENSAGRILKNAFLLSISMLPRTILMVVIDAAPLLLLLFAPDWFGRTFIIWFLLGFALCGQGKVWVLKDVFSELPEIKKTSGKMEKTK